MNTFGPFWTLKNLEKNMSKSDHLVAPKLPLKLNIPESKSTVDVRVIDTWASPILIVIALQSHSLGSRTLGIHCSTSIPNSSYSPRSRASTACIRLSTASSSPMATVMSSSIWESAETGTNMPPESCRSSKQQPPSHLDYTTSHQY